LHTKGSETMFCSVDRIEEGLAVCVNDMGVTFAVKLSDISGEVHEGSVLIDTGSGYIACPGEEQKRRDENFSLAESLFDE
jgi:hypothetical protein